MIRKRSWRYYCEHCGKSSGSGGHMARHEKTCTKNPYRECRMCKSERLRDMLESVERHWPQPPFSQDAIQWLFERLGAGDIEGVHELRKAVGGCPACMLTIVRASGLDSQIDPEHGPVDEVAFDFKRERDAWFAWADSWVPVEPEGLDPFHEGISLSEYLDARLESEAGPGPHHL